MTTKGYLIDPVSRIITLVDVGDYTDIQKLIGCHCFTVATYFPNGDSVYIDDEGLLNAGNLSFNIEGAHQPFFGKGLLIGCNEEGENTDPIMDMASFAQMVNYDNQRLTTGM